MSETDWDRRMRREREWLAGLSVGDVVAYYGGSWSKPELVPVARLTDAQIVLGNRARFWRKNGRSVGGQSLYSRASIAEPTDELKREIWRHHAVSQLSNVQWSYKSDATLTAALKVVRNDDTRSQSSQEADAKGIVQ